MLSSRTAIASAAFDPTAVLQPKKMVRRSNAISAQLGRRRGFPLECLGERQGKVARDLRRTRSVREVALVVGAAEQRLVQIEARTLGLLKH